MLQKLNLNQVINSRPGWYKGNLHSHTCFSEDARSTPEQLLEIAVEEGLDFFAVTDHNSIDALPEFPTAGADILVIPGIEVTLTDGHFNVFGLLGWLDWMEHICTGQSTIRLNGHFGSVTELIRRIKNYGLISSINHPRRGMCEWRDSTTDLRLVDCLEIWNKPHSYENRRANPEAIALWTEWLNAGYRTTAVGGSDYHGSPGERLGLPATYVYGSELSAVGILKGLRQRRVYVSMGPEVSFQACVNGSTYDIGADMGLPKGEVEFSAGVSGNEVPGHLRIVKNGQVVAETPIRDQRASLHIKDRIEPERPAWYRLEVVDESGQMLAITNPVFAGPRYEPERHLFGEFDN